ncbi:MAG TPA: hypothetical protein VEB21_03280 [Terriglobales bacterium]|nr:hypothetical protein [Terriglobales bacterium]
MTLLRIIAVSVSVVSLCAAGDHLTPLENELIARGARGDLAELPVSGGGLGGSEATEEATGSELGTARLLDHARHRQRGASRTSPLAVRTMRLEGPSSPGRFALPEPREPERRLRGNSTSRLRC